jgi:hypothetical protein
LFYVFPGDDVTVDMVNDVLTNNSTGKTYQLKPIGEVSMRHSGVVGNEGGGGKM